MKPTIARSFFTFLLGPWMLIPVAFAIAYLVGLHVYEPPEIHRDLERHIFLQGSTDLGGGCLFAGTIALYVAFGFLAAWYVTLKLDETGPDTSLRQTIKRAVWILRFHILAFVAGGTINIGYDSRVTPNDFRNLFLFVAMLHGFSIILISYLHHSRLTLRWKLILAPLLTVLWLIIGADGNTARAGQLVQSGQDPQPVVRSARHHLMLTWHEQCDRFLGDVGSSEYTENTDLSWLYPSALFTTVLLIFQAVGRVMSRRTGYSMRSFWIRVGVLLVAGISTITAFRFRSYSGEQKLIRPVLEQLAQNITPETIDLFKSDPALSIRETNLIKNNQLSARVVSEIDRIYERDYFTNGFTIRLLVPLEPDYFFFLWQNPSFRYADVRKIKSPHSQLIDYEVVQFMLDHSTDYMTPFISRGVGGLWDMLLNKPDVLGGRQLTNSAGQVVGILLVQR